MDHPLTTFELNSMMADVALFIGAFSADTIPVINKFPAAFIVNTDPSSAPGEHWTSIILKKGGRAIYFDPLGFPPLVPSVRLYLEENAPNGFKYSCVTIQEPTGIKCGSWCMAFIRHHSLGGTLRTFVSQFAGSVGQQLAANDRWLSALNL